MQEKSKIDKMGKSKREVEFLEKGMQRFKTKLQKLQQDPALAPSMSTVGLRPKQFVDQHNCHVTKEGKVQGTHDNDRYIGPYSTIEQQIRANAMLSKQIYEEEQKQFEKQIKQTEKKDPMNTILIQWESRQSLIKLIL